MNPFSRVRSLFRKEKLDVEMSEEMRAHLELQAAENEKRGLSPHEARYAAQRAFGGVEQIKERCRDERTRGFMWIDQLAQDVRYAARTLRRSPGFTVLAIAMLAVGIGASAVVFSAVKGILLRPLPFSEADQLVWIFSTNAAQGVVRERISNAELADLRTRSRSFAALASINVRNAVLHEGETPEELHGLTVTPELFDVLRVEPVAGRLPSDITSGDNGAILISYELWQRRFGGAAEAIGGTLRLDSNQSRTLVGVLPPGLEFPLARSPQVGNGDALAPGRKDFWTLGKREASVPDRGARYQTVIARLRPEVNVTQANAELRSIAGALAAEHPATNTGWSYFAEPLREQILGPSGPAVKVLAVAVGLVLLLVCANVANSLFCRGLVRSAELALRAALGASRGRILRQLLVESMLLASLGGIAGVMLAAAGVKALQLAGPATLPFLREIVLDGPGLGAALGLTLISGLLAGLAPAWRFSQPNPQAALRSGGANATAAMGTVRLKNTLVVVQIAATIVLLSATALLLESFVRLTNVNLGYQPQSVLVAELNLSDSKGADFRPRVFDRLQGLPWVKAAGAVHSVPLTGTWSIRDRFKIMGRTEPREGGWEASLSFIGFDYFEAMGIPLLRGRNFDRQESLDMRNAPVAIVSESFAQKFFPGEDALGKTILVPGPRERRIVGIVRDTRDARIEAAPEPQFYLPLVLGDFKLVVATTGRPADHEAMLRDEIAALDPRVRIGRLTPLSGIVAGLLEERRFALMLLIGFAAIALLLGSASIYGVLSYGVAQRRKEIGVRMALGAQPREIMRMILAQGARLTWQGAFIGVAVAFAGMRFLESLLFEVKSTDPLGYAAALGVLAAMALLACYLPARRATKVDPMVALRAE
jgi:predicted permease